MDPGTIIAVATAATTVLSLLSKYAQDVKNAREDVERLLKQIEDIHSLLLRIETIATSPYSAKLPALDTALTAIKKTFSDIQELVEKLKPKTSKRLMSKVGLRALKWPFTKEEMASYIIRLESEKTSLTLALQADSTQVFRKLLLTIEAYPTSTVRLFLPLIKALLGSRNIKIWLSKTGSWPNLLMLTAPPSIRTIA